MALSPDFTLEHIVSLTTNTDISPQILKEQLADLEPSAANLPHVPENAELLSLYYCSFLFALLLLDDVTEARFLSKRILTSFSTSAPPGTVLSPSDQTWLETSYPIIPPTNHLVRAVYTRSYRLIYHALHTTPWTPAIQPLVQAFLEQFRRQTFNLLSHAYTFITPSQAAVCLGFEDDSDQVVIEKLTAEGWLWDSEQGLLKTIVREDDEELFGGVISGKDDGKDGRVKKLTNLVTHLTEV